MGDAKKESMLSLGLEQSGNLPGGEPLAPLTSCVSDNVLSAACSTVQMVSLFPCHSLLSTLRPILLHNHYVRING